MFIQEANIHLLLTTITFIFFLLKRPNFLQSLQVKPCQGCLIQLFNLKAYSCLDWGVAKAVVCSTTHCQPMVHTACSRKHCSLKIADICQYGYDAGNTAEENSSVFSLI